MGIIIFTVITITAFCFILTTVFTWLSSIHHFIILAGASLNTIKRTVKYLCPADIIPPYIEVDLSELDVGQKVLMGDLNIHPALKLLHSKDEAVCKIMGQRVSEQQPKKSK